VGFGETVCEESGLPEDEIGEVLCEGLVVLDGEEESVVYPVEEGVVIGWGVGFEGYVGDGGR
jgi:hypothetical protein